MAFGVGASLPPQLDLEAIHVQNYARNNPNEDDDEPPAQAGAPGVSESLAPAAGATSSPSAVEVPLDEHGVKRHEHADEVDQTKRARFADDAFSILEAGFLLDDSAVGEHAPKTPRLDDTTYKQKLNQITSTDLSLYEHEDMPVSFSMSLFWKKMKALFLQTKICEISQIKINKNPPCLVVNKHLLKVETSNQTW